MGFNFMGLLELKRQGINMIIFTLSFCHVTSPALIPTDALLNIVLFGKDTQHDSLMVLMCRIQWT